MDVVMEAQFQWLMGVEHFPRFMKLGQATPADRPLSPGNSLTFYNQLTILSLGRLLGMVALTLSNLWS